MELRRFYVEPGSVVNDTVTISGNEYRHMTSVLRFKVGYKAIVCDNSGYDYYCTVTSIDARQAVCRVDSIAKNEAELANPPILCLGLIKPEKLEIAVQKAVEIGVRTIRPFGSRNTSEIAPRQERLERIVLESCKQCGRAVLPTVQPVVPFEQLFDGTPTWLAYEKERALGLRQCVQRYYQKDKPLQLVVGSEGGFCDEEVAFARQNGAITVGLGKRILRAETASIVALGTVVCMTEDV